MTQALLNRWRQAPLTTLFLGVLVLVLLRLVVEFGGGFVDGLIAGFRD